jgi:hypothetical protein
VDYTDDDWSTQARAAAEGRGFDVVFDGIGGELGTKTYDLVASGGRFSAHGAPSGSFADIDRQDAAARDITLIGIEAAQFEPGDVHRLTRAAYEAAAAVTIRAVVGQSFALHEARAAHEAIEARQVSGKTVLLSAAATSEGVPGEHAHRRRHRGPLERPSRGRASRLGLRGGGHRQRAVVRQRPAGRPAGPDADSRRDRRWNRATVSR